MVMAGRQNEATRWRTGSRLHCSQASRAKASREYCAASKQAGAIDVFQGMAGKVSCLDYQYQHQRV